MQDTMRMMLRVITVMKKRKTPANMLRKREPCRTGSTCTSNLSTLSSSDIPALLPPIVSDI